MKLLLHSFLISSVLGQGIGRGPGRDPGHGPPPGVPGGPGGPPPGIGGPPPEIPPFEEIPPLVQAELDRCGSVVDTHMHLATWFSAPEPLLAEMTASGIQEGVIMAVYGPSNPFGTDPNEEIAKLVAQDKDGSARRLHGLASLNTTHADWDTHRDAELERLATFLEKPGMVGAKIAPPHTNLPMNSPILEEVIATIASSSHPVLGIHIGTTPFCGPFGDFILGQKGNCDPEYVDPYFLEPFIQAFPDVTFVLMHGGQDFSPPDDPIVPFYNGENFDHSVELANKHSNVYIEISANLDRTEDGEYENPLAMENLRKLVTGGVQAKTIYGGDANAFPGRLLDYLNSTVVSLIDAGFTETERCNVLVANTLEAYGFTREIDDDHDGDHDHDASPISGNIDLYTDAFPDETSFLVRNKATNKVVARFDGNLNSEPDSMIRTTAKFEPGATYEFEIKDRGGDGICCSGYGEGRVEITGVLSDGKVVTLLDFDGEFRTSWNSDFVIPSNGDDPEDPEEEVCEDSFPVCFGFLCRFTSSVCQATCDAC